MPNEALNRISKLSLMRTHKNTKKKQRHYPKPDSLVSQHLNQQLQSRTSSSAHFWLLIVEIKSLKSLAPSLSLSLSPSSNRIGITPQKKNTQSFPAEIIKKKRWKSCWSSSNHHIRYYCCRCNTSLTYRSSRSIMIRTSARRDRVCMGRGMTAPKRQSWWREKGQPSATTLDNKKRRRSSAADFVLFYIMLLS